VQSSTSSTRHGYLLRPNLIARIALTVPAARHVISARRSDAGTGGSDVATSFTGSTRASRRRSGHRDEALLGNGRHVRELYPSPAAGVRPRATAERGASTIFKFFPVSGEAEPIDGRAP
jgi:hypothetical protein